MKSILVIGAGKFGHHIAEYLCDMGNDVMLVDKDEALIDTYADKVTEAEIGDFTIKNNLEALNVKDYDYIFVCIGISRIVLLSQAILRNSVRVMLSERHHHLFTKNSCCKMVRMR